MKPPSTLSQKNPPIRPRTNTRKRKATYSSSPIGYSDTPIYRLAHEFQQYLFFPDPMPLYVLAGSLIANMHVGHPVWLMLLGSPGCGKGQLLNALLNLDGVRGASEINGTQALLSGVKVKDRWKDSKGGLLNEIGNHGALVIEEFTSILSLEKDKLAKMLAAFRSIYYGKWTRDVGTEGGRSLDWEGKVALFAGCTNAGLDRHHSISSEMGERWIYYRFDATEGWAESKRNLNTNMDPADVREQLSAAIIDFVTSLGLEWGRPKRNRDLTQEEQERLIAIAQFASRAQSAIVRNDYSHEIVDVPVPAPPMRIANTLAQLFMGMESAGLEYGECWRGVRKVAMDCMPLIRRQAIRAIQMGNGKGGAYSDITKYLGVSPMTCKRVLEDLQAHGIIDKSGTNGAGVWVLSERAEDSVKRGFTDV